METLNEMTTEDLCLWIIDDVKLLNEVAQVFKGECFKKFLE